MKSFFEAAGKNQDETGVKTGYNKRFLWSCFGLSLAALLVFLTQLGNPLSGGHSDEPLYIGIAVEMLARRDWILPTLHGVPALYKPPLLYWMMIAAFHLLGSASLLAARIPAALCGAGTPVLVALLGNKLWKDPASGRLAGWLALTTIPGLYAYSRAALMDVPLLFLLTASLYAALLARERESPGWLGLSFMLAGLSSLLKGPIACLMIAVPLWVLLGGSWRRLFRGRAVLGLLAGIALLSFWPLALWARGYGKAWLDFFLFQENLGKFSPSLDPTTHPTPGSVIVTHLFSQFLPWSFFLIAALLLVPGRRELRAREFFFVLAWVAGVVFLFMLPQKKLSHYTLPAIPGSALLVSGVLLRGRDALPVRVAFWITGIVFALVGALLFLMARIAGGAFDVMVVLSSAAAFFVGTWFLFRKRLQSAAQACAFFLFLYALGLPHLMAPVDLEALRKAMGTGPVYAYKTDLAILARSLGKEILPVTQPGDLRGKEGMLLLPEAERTEFLRSGIHLSPPHFAWKGWKDHIRILDILQAIVDGKREQIQEEMVVSRIE